MSNKTQTLPPADDTLTDKAFACGRDYDPDDARSRWIDAYEGDDYKMLVEAYQEGQAERYENEDW